MAFKSLKNLRIRTKFVVGFSVVFLFFISVAFVGLFFISKVAYEHKTLELLQKSEVQLSNVRLNTRIFMHSRDTSYYNKSKNLFNKLHVIITELDSNNEYNENVELFKKYNSLLDDYNDLMVSNYKTMKTQDSTIELRREIFTKIELLNKQNHIAENSMFNYYLLYARLANTQIFAYQKSSYYEIAKKYGELAIEESEKLKFPEITELLVEYKSAQDKFFEVYTQEENIIANTVIKGEEILKTSSEIENNITQFIDDYHNYSILFTILFLIIALSVSVIIVYGLTWYFKTMIGKGVYLGKVYAQGDLSFKISDEDYNLKDEVGELTRSMVDMAEKMKGIIGDVMNTTKSLTDSSLTVSSTSQQISHGASEQASSLEEISSSIEELASNTDQNAANAIETEKIALKTSDELNSVTQKAKLAMEANRIINEKITIINDIAFQTNILALNAAVEAARAGDHGKGFAVVASEVRKLAERSKIAADEIVGLSKESLELSEQSGVQMFQILPEMEKTLKLVKEIAAASAEQSNGIEQINNAIQQLNQISQQNAAASEELATSSETMSEQANMLQDKVGYFKLE